MRTIYDEADRQALHARVDAVSPDAKPVWGRMDAPAMMEHHAGALSMYLGDVTIAAVGPQWLGRLIKGPCIAFLPWPKGAPTAPELIGKSGADFEAERANVHERLERLAQRGPDGPFGTHPLFGPLSRAQWGRLAWRHADHHLRQFGV